MEVGDKDPEACGDDNDIDTCDIDGVDARDIGIDACDAGVDAREAAEIDGVWDNVRCDGLGVAEGDGGSVNA